VFVQWSEDVIVALSDPAPSPVPARHP